jgi:hypothetical protein
VHLAEEEALRRQRAWPRRWEDEFPCRPAVKSVRVKEEPMRQELVALLNRGVALGGPLVTFGGSQHMEGVDQWQRKVPDLLPAHVQQVADQLDEHEVTHRRRMEAQERERQREADRAAAARPLDFDDPADLDAQRVLRMRADAAEAARLAASPATREQLDRLIALTEEVRDALRKRA